VVDKTTEAEDLAYAKVDKAAYETAGYALCAAELEPDQFGTGKACDEILRGLDPEIVAAFPKKRLSPPLIFAINRVFGENLQPSASAARKYRVETTRRFLSDFRSASDTADPVSLRREAVENYPKQLVKLIAGTDPEVAATYRTVYPHG
jgi:hypothetical protein